MCLRSAGGSEEAVIESVLPQGALRFSRYLEAVPGSARNIILFVLR